jgi:hypothetical protein
MQGIWLRSFAKRMQLTQMKMLSGSLALLTIRSDATTTRKNVLKSKSQ